MICAARGATIQNQKSEIKKLMNALKSFASKHPRLAAWLALALGMVLILLWASKDVGLLPTQLAALIVATIALAGLCVWIIGWEDDDENETADASVKSSNAK
jgi:hypothetical protein